MELKEKIRTIPPRSFITRTHFPGLTGNPFDRVLHKALLLESIPIILLFGFLLGLSFLLSGLDLKKALVIFIFYLSDFILLTFLPILNISFGPVKPPLLLLAFLRTLFWLLPFSIAIWFEIAGIFLILYGFYYEPTDLKITQQIVQSPKIPINSEIRLLHLGDLHIERLTQREKRILARVNDLAPDLILFSGDLLNLSYLADPSSQEAVKQFLNGLSAPLGVYGVSGSPAVDLPDLFPRLVAETPLTWLNDREIEISKGQCKISITGLTCTHQPEKDFARLQRISDTHPNEFKILLYHTPDIAPLSCQLGFDLQLSGHTHGGQVCLPILGALFDGSLYRKSFESGRYRLKSMILYVTRGIGLEGAAAPRVRFLCPPEITLWSIHS